MPPQYQQHRAMALRSHCTEWHHRPLLPISGQMTLDTTNLEPGPILLTTKAPVLGPAPPLNTAVKGVDRFLRVPGGQ